MTLATSLFSWFPIGGARHRALRVGASRCAVLLSLVLSACPSAPGDRAGRAPPSRPSESETPPRWVSVGGAVTETIFALGLGAQVVGVDTSSVYPPAATSLPKVGYQRTLSAEGVLALRPTRVLVSEDAGPPHALEQLRTARIPVEIIRGEASPQGARAKIRQLAQLLQVPQRGEALIAALETDLQQAQRVAVPHRAGSRRLSVLFVYARSAGAVLVAGRDTAPDAMLRLAEVDNAAAALTGFKPYSAEVLATLRPDVLLLTDRGAQSLGGAAGLRQVPGLASVPEERVVTIDDLQLLGFGPRTGQALVALKTQLAALAQRQRRLAATPSTVAAVQP